MQVARWGDSLAVRLPKALVDALGLKEATRLKSARSTARPSRHPSRRRSRKSWPRSVSSAAWSRLTTSSSAQTRTKTTDFFDTNILVYAVSSDVDKAHRAEPLMASGGVISVQVLNEFVAVNTRKLGNNFGVARQVLARFRAICTVVPVDVETHDDGLDLAERYRLPVYDAMIVAAALRAGCRTLYTEDFADGQVLDGLTICNPFVRGR